MDLRQFGSEAVARACGRWRLTQDRRPTPANIVKLAVEERKFIAESEEMQKSGKKPYAMMTEAERQVFHTNIYAFRRVVLGADDTTSPCDPKGEWYRADLVDEEVRRRRPRHEDVEMQREGRSIVTAWAKERGFDTIDAYAEANGIPFVNGVPADAYRMVAVEILASAEKRRREAMGIVRPEYKPSYEQMAAARRDLGLE